MIYRDVLQFYVTETPFCNFVICNKGKQMRGWDLVVFVIFDF